MKRFGSIVVAAAFAASACTTSRETSPPRTATEQLLISTAAERAAERIALPIQAGAKVFVDPTNFDGIDAKYAIAAIRDHLLRKGANLVAERGHAEVIVEIRAGALAVDEHKTLVGIPRFDVPVPLAGAFTVPEIALFKRSERRGVAKFVATGYRASDGGFVGASDPEYGFAHKKDWVVLLFVSWTTDDVLPEGAGGSRIDLEAPALP
jgi:hypothetical protein